MPDNEGQFRELARLSDPREREEVLVAAVEVVSEEEDGRLTARVLREQVDKLKSRNPVRRQQTPGQRLEKAREKLGELEQILAGDEDPGRAIRALRKILGD